MSKQTWEGLTSKSSEELTSEARGGPRVALQTRVQTLKTELAAAEQRLAEFDDSQKPSEQQ